MQLARCAGAAGHVWKSSEAGRRGGSGQVVCAWGAARGETSSAGNAPCVSRKCRALTAAAVGDVSSSPAAARARHHGLGPPPAPRVEPRRQPARAARDASPRPCQWPRGLGAAGECRRATHSRRATHTLHTRVDRGATCRAAQRQRPAVALAQPRHSPLLHSRDCGRGVPELVPGLMEVHLDAGAGATRPLTATLTLHAHAHPLTHPDLHPNLQVLAPGGASLFTPGRNGTEALYATRGLEPRPSSLQPAPYLPTHFSFSRAVCLASPRLASPHLTSHLTSPHLSPHLTSPRLTSHLTSPRLASPHLSPHLASPRLTRRRARLEVGQPLVYPTRWRPSTTREGSWVVDRAFNTQAISAASMGPKAVQNCETNGADQVEPEPKP